MLFITVEPPAWGDDIHSLRQEGVDIRGRAIRSGTVFVRKLGKTEPANASDLDRLAERVKAGGRALSLSIEAEQDEVVAISTDLLSEARCDSVVAELREEYLAGVPSETTSSLKGFALGGTVSVSETRRPGEYRKQVEAWLDRVRKNWTTYVAAKFAEEDSSPLDLVIVNNTDEVFQDVQVEVTFPLDPRWVAVSTTQRGRRFRPPTPPPKWEKQLDIASTMGDIPVVGAGTEVEEVTKNDTKLTLVRFKPLLVRPRSRHRLGHLVLILPPVLADQSIPCQWRATASNTTGQVEGRIQLAVAPDPAAESEAA